MAGFKSAPPPRLMALPAKRVVAYPMEAVVSGGSTDDKVGAAPRNIEHVPAAVHDRLLEPEEAVVARCDVAEATGSLLSAAILTGRLPHIPQTKAVRDHAARLLDPAISSPAGRRACGC